MDVNQSDLDQIWSHYQDHAREVFDSSYSRLQFLAKRCRPASEVLNIGAGSGYLESLLMLRGVNTHCLDPSDRTVKRLNEEMGLRGRARQGYCDGIPFPDESFDTVILTEVLEHIPADKLEASLAEISRVLRRDGRLIGTVPYREVLLDSEVYCPKCQARFHRWGHMNSFDTVSLRNLLQGSGFAIEKLYPRTFPDFRRPGVKLFLRAAFRYVLGRMGEPLVSPNLYFVARLSEEVRLKKGIIECR